MVAGRGRRIGGGEQRSGSRLPEFDDRHRILQGLCRCFACLPAADPLSAYEKMALSNPVGSSAAERRSQSHPMVISAASQVDGNQQEQEFLCLVVVGPLAVAVK